MLKRQLFFCLLGVLTCITATYSQTLLEYSLKPGQIYKIKQVAKQQMEQKIEGTTHEISNELGGIFQFKIEEKLASSYKIEMQFLEFKMKSTSNLQGVLMEVDTKNPSVSDEMTTKIFGALIGTPLQMEMTTAGKITSVTGGDALIDKMAAATGLDEATQEIMKGSLRKEFSSEGLAQSFEQMTFIYPGQKKAQGEQWNTQFNGKINADNLWTLEKVSGKIASITGTAEITMQNQDANLILELTGNQEIALESDLNSGFLTKMMVQGTGEGKSIMASMGMEIPTTLTQTITYELITD
ncbi:hypothetical protein BUL40_06465 [Croceivirga radicis]|uniref:Uncharacterized protein n=2 Tax=Croceivirga radicis TaxID=1929488 RepID=A0A1V6LTL4_9FLAO|nr:hypothetical protein BUL40_06465 [Croceivirga radicis]